MRKHSVPLAQGLTTSSTFLDIYLLYLLVLKSHLFSSQFVTSKSKILVAQEEEQQEQLTYSYTAILAVKYVIIQYSR